MTAPSSNVPITYAGALRDYLARPDEETLEHAYELGRAAMNAGLGVFDIVRLHHAALAEGMVPRGPAGDEERYAPMLETFMLEVLSPFEAAHRGFRTALERMEHLNRELEDRNERLAAGNAQLQELSAQVLTAQEEERKRISRELHDEIGQALTAVNVTVAMLKKQAGDDQAFQRKVAEAEALLAQSMETVHTFARELRPSMLDHLGVHAALRAHVAAFTRRTGIKVDLHGHADLERAQGALGETIFRVAQEALSNVFKHAGATKVKILFSSDGLTLNMEIADNGKAFKVEEKFGAKRGRIGLLGMQERVRLIEGKFAIDSMPGRGTRVVVWLPLPKVKTKAEAPAAAVAAPAADAGAECSSSPSSSNSNSTNNQHEENYRIAS